MNKRHYEHTLPNIRGSLSNTYAATTCFNYFQKIIFHIVTLVFILNITFLFYNLPYRRFLDNRVCTIVCIR